MIDNEERTKGMDLAGLLECVREGLHPEQVEALIREAHDAGVSHAAARMRVVAAGYGKRGDHELDKGRRPAGLRMHASAVALNSVADELAPAARLTTVD